MPPAWAVWAVRARTAPGTGRELGNHELNDRVVWSEGGGAGAPVRCIASGGGGRGDTGTGPWSQALLVPRPCLVFPSPFPVLQSHPAGTEAYGFRAKRSR